MKTFPALIKTEPHAGRWYCSNQCVCFAWIGYSVPGCLADWMRETKKGYGMPGPECPAHGKRDYTHPVEITLKVEGER